MRAARLHAYGPAENLIVEEVEPPSCGPDDLLIRVHAASVNPVDCKVRKGSHRAILRYKKPIILGLDVSGVVEAVGDHVKGWSVGDEVYSSPHHKRPGAYAEKIAVRAEEVARKPSNLSHAEAASIPLVGLTAWRCLVDDGKLEAGEKALIHAGSGGVGSFAIQLAKHLGAEVATTCSGRNVELVTGLGADRVVDYTQERFEEVLEPQDYVLDAFGGDMATRSMKIAKRGGRVIAISTGLPQYAAKVGPYLGVAAAGIGIGINKLRALFHGVRYRAAVRHADGLILGQITELIEAGVIQPVIDSTFPLEAIVDAHKRSETGRARGKIIVTMD